MTSAVSAHVCPQCQSESVERDRRTPIERLLGAFLHRRPYRCRACGRRFWDRPVSADS